MTKQHKLVEDEKDEFVEELNLTPEKIRADMEAMKSVEGFPIGDDDDILELSNPPYYTAYPNPYIKDFIKKYGKPYDPETDDYHREPFVGDVSEGKNDPVYNAHSYHTKVPHKAIIEFIKHYTDRDDVILDGFCGSGMTGVAAKFTGRNCVLIDLSPFATFVSNNYTHPTDPNDFISECKKIMNESLNELSWMYTTKHKDGATGTINYTVWSDVMICPFCNNEYVFFDVAYDESVGKIKAEYSCPHCSSLLSKVASKKVEIEFFDPTINEKITQIKKVPAQINYSVGKTRYEKKPDADDLKVISKITALNSPYWFPSYQMMFSDGQWGDIWRSGYHQGITHTHHFFFKRNLIAYSALWNKSNSPLVRWALSSIQSYINKKQSFTGGGGGMPGVLYIASLVQEKNVFDVFQRKVKKISNFVKSCTFSGNSIVSTQGCNKLSNIPENSIDYIFTDPPFGANIMYSEASFLWESWLKVFTNNSSEAIINSTQKKKLSEYRLLLYQGFREYARVLKPNRWITVEFHNSKAEIWKAIQDAIVKSGFIIGQVAVLDKKQGSFKQVTSAGAVKNDLVINAYKPSEEFRMVFLKKAGLNMEREFIKMHLDKLPVEPNVERTQQMLYSKLLAQYIQNGFEVRMDAAEFYSTLKNHFIERDGFWFNQEQIPEYEKRVKLKKSLGKFNLDQAILGISDEKSAIVWLAQFLRNPRSYSEISIEFNKSLMTSQDQIPELKIMLEENFVTEGGQYRLPSINEKKEKEDMRAKRLQKEFNDIIQEAKTGKKVKEVRKEALLHGLMELYNKRAVDEIKLLGAKLDNSIIESDDEIYAIIDWANSKED